MLRSFDRIRVDGRSSRITAGKLGETFSVKAGRPHLVTNAAKTSTTFLVLQGIGEYDFVPLI